jgi:hypothetical protein
MVLSKREQVILAATIAVVGFFVAYKVIYTPVQTRLTEMDAQRSQLLSEVNEAKSLFERKRRFEPAWQKILDEGFANDTEAESRVFRELGQWSRQARLDVTSTKPDRISAEKGLKEMTFVIAGEGTPEAMAQFLWLMETSPLPVKVKQMTLSSSSESGNDMSLELRLSALYLDTDQKSSEDRNVGASYEELL